MQKNVSCKAPNDPKAILHQQHVAFGGERSQLPFGETVAFQTLSMVPQV